MAGALDIIQVVAEMALFGQQLLNVFEWVYTDPVDDDDLMDDMQQVIEEAVYELIQPHMDNELTFEQLSFRNLTDNVLIGTRDWLSLTAGGSATEALPLGVAALITLPTTVPKVRGRKFFPGLTEANCVNSLWGTTLTDVLTQIGGNLVGGFLGPISGAPATFGVRRQNGSFVAFNEALVSNVPAYQRRRKPGVGA